MKISTFFIAFVLVSAVFLTACQKKEITTQPAKPSEIQPDTAKPAEPAATGITEEVDIVSEDEVDIGELI